MSTLKNNLQNDSLAIIANSLDKVHKFSDNFNEDLSYFSGFGNYHSSEALPGALPTKQNSPQRAPYGLFAEQLNGSAFTANRDNNKRTWLYRIRPATVHCDSYQPLLDEMGHLKKSPPVVAASPQNWRWSANNEQQNNDFLTSLFPFCDNGTSTIYNYSANKSMSDTVTYNADGEWVILPVSGNLRIMTELGCLDVSPGELLAIPRGINFTVILHDQSKQATGYAIENRGAAFKLPELGPIGANGLANIRDFKSPTACIKDTKGPLKLIVKNDQQWWSTTIQYSPFDVVAWHGNYLPYVYNINNFNTLGSVSYDHPDPSIYTLLTSPSYTEQGTAAIDLAVFPARWLVADNTFRPPYFHRNIMSEAMGLIYGAYDAKKQGFEPGGLSLHNCMSGHGPDPETFANASTNKLKPEYLDNTLAFMLESNSYWRPTKMALHHPTLQKDYYKIWQNLPVSFDENNR